MTSVARHVENHAVICTRLSLKVNGNYDAPEMYMINSALTAHEYSWLAIKYTT